MDAEIIYYSATGTTKKIVKAFSEGLDCDVRFIDITRPENREAPVALKNSLVIIAVPIYGERIPHFIYEYLKGIDGQNKPLVAFSVYGNVGYGISLAQFKTYALENHYKLIGAGAFIGEHTYSDKNHPIAYGRPDYPDLVQARLFGKQIREKYVSGNLSPIDLPDPKLPAFITKFPDSGTRLLIRQPAVDTTRCLSCGLCVKNCPVGAIDPDSLKIDEEKCVRCFACVKSCPEKARRAEFSLKLFETVLTSAAGGRKDNQIFI